jgi:hypothetical protein
LPSKVLARDLLTRDTFLLYYIRKTKFKGSINQLSQKLGYPDDSAMNKRINRLQGQGLLILQGTGAETEFKLTSKGIRHMYYLLMPKYTLFAVGALSFGYVWWGIGAIFLGVPLNPQYILLTGLVSLILTMVVAYLYVIGERQLWEPYEQPLQE